MRDQLDQALTDKNVAVRELARRLAGGNLPPKPKWEAQRRWVNKVLSGKVKRPTAAKIRRVEDALGLAHGYFKIPTAAQARADVVTDPEIRRRLEGVEKTLTDLTVALQKEAPEVAARILRLERLVLPDTQQEDQAEQDGP